VVIQCVVHEVGSGTIFPVLTRGNYTKWVMLMRVKLKARGLWVIVKKGEVDLQEDMMAMDALLLVLLPEMVATVAEKKTVKEAWNMIATMCVSDDRVKKVATQQLHNQFDQAAFKEGELVEDFMLCETVEEHVVVENILRCVPPWLKQIALAIPRCSTFRRSPSQT
jgi:hypothetical protein